MSTLNGITIYEVQSLNDPSIKLSSSKLVDDNIRDKASVPAGFQVAMSLFCLTEIIELQEGLNDAYHHH